MNYYFSLARQAQTIGLRVLGADVGSTIAVPRFICSDVPAALVASGFDVMYYDIDQSLQPDFTKSVPKCDFLVAVNYFGFPSDLAAISRHWNIPIERILEDNAHGLLSVDNSGTALGARTGVGVISFRKSLRTVDGGILLVNADHLKTSKSLVVLEPSRQRLPIGFRIRQIIAATERRLGVPLMNIARLLRRTAKYRLPQSFDPESVTARPVHIESLRRLNSCDADAERHRRRNSYRNIAPIVQSVGAQLFFDELPVGVVPYGIPFIAPDTVAREVQRRLWLQGLEVFRWPDLPEDVQCPRESWYQNTHLVSLLQ